MKSETVKNLNQGLKEKELLEEKQRETITKSNYLVVKKFFMREVKYVISAQIQ